jgi:hypothetical protein
VSDDQTGSTVGEPPADELVSPQAAAPAPPQAQPPEGKRSHGVTIVLGLLLALVLGALSAAIIAKGDDGATTTTIAPTKTVVSGTTTVKQVTTTVTAPADITLTPDVTLAPDGSLTSPEQGGSQTGTTSGSQTDTTPTTTTTTP